jgi:hypothetical protein
MVDSIKDYMDRQQTENVAHIIINNFERIIEQELTEDEKEFAFDVTYETFKKYTVEHKKNIFVADDDSKQKLSNLLEQFTDKLSAIIVHFIYSRIEAYMLYKKLNEDG